MRRPILRYGEPVLHTRAAPVPAVTPQTDALIDDMRETMQGAAGVGLAYIPGSNCSHGGASGSTKEPGLVFVLMMVESFVFWSFVSRSAEAFQGLVRSCHCLQDVLLAKVAGLSEQKF